MKVLILVFLTLFTVPLASGSRSGEIDAENLCERFSYLHMCQLNKHASGAVKEINFLLAHPKLRRIFETKDLRKKREDEDEDQDQDQDMERGARNSRQIPVKKRSQYIRFG